MNATDIKLTERTWLGQRGESGDSAPCPQPRVSVHRWLEEGAQGRAGHTTVRAIRGDGRTDDFQCFHTEELPPEATEEDLDWAIDRCACALLARKTSR